MPPPLAPWFLVAGLVGAAGPEVPRMMEPSHEADGSLMTAARPLLGCALWSLRAAQPAWIKPTGPLGGGSHALPLPEKIASLPAWYEAACYNAHGWSERSQGVVRLDLVWGPWR